MKLIKSIFIILLSNQLLMASDHTKIKSYVSIIKRFEKDSELSKLSFHQINEVRKILAGTVVDLQEVAPVTPLPPPGPPPGPGPGPTPPPLPLPQGNVCLGDFMGHYQYGRPGELRIILSPGPQIRQLDVQVIYQGKLYRGTGTCRIRSASVADISITLMNAPPHVGRIQGHSFAGNQVVPNGVLGLGFYTQRY